MNSIPKFVTSVIAFMIALLVCIGLVFTGVIVTTAKTYHNNVIGEIEDSYFHEDVINQCIQNAEDKGFALTVSKEMNVSSTIYYKVTLYYDLSLPLFGKVHTGKLVGYAYPGASIEGLVGTADHYFEIDSNGVLGIKPAYRWATQTAEYCSDSNDPTVAGSKNDQLPSEITIPTYWNGVKVKALRDYMFVNCSELTKISFEEGVETIGSCAFQNCVNLDGTVAAANSITDIKANAFENCSQLDALTFSSASALETIGNYAFQNCVSFINVDLPDSLVENGYGAFKGCNQITSYKAPFAGGYDDISYVNIEIDGVEKKVYPTSIGYIFGAEPTEEEAYTYQANNAFVPTSLKKVHITKYVYKYSCYDLDSLTELVLGDDIVKFDSWPFAYCDGLTKVTIPKNVATTSYGAFGSCANLEEVVFADNSVITTLGNSSFEECTKLKTIKLPSTLRKLDDSCFENCDSLLFDTVEHGKLPEGITHLGRGCFRDSDGFETIIIPASVTVIEPYIFTKCTKLTNIQVATGSNSFSIGVNGELLTLDKTEIVQYPYAASTSYVIPETVTKIREAAFYYTTNLSNVDFSKAFTKNILTFIGDSAFAHCGKIANSIALPKSVVTIDDSAFYYAGSWMEFWIGPNVNTIGYSAFYGAGHSYGKTYLLTDVAPTLGTKAFAANKNASSSVTYYVVVKDTVASAFVTIADNSSNYNINYAGNLIVNNNIDYGVSIDVE